MCLECKGVMMRKLFEWIVKRWIAIWTEKRARVENVRQIQNLGLEKIVSLKILSAYRHPYRATSVLDGAPTGTQTGV